MASAFFANASTRIINDRIFGGAGDGPWPALVFSSMASNRAAVVSASSAALPDVKAFSDVSRLFREKP
jgi:hypothetical protein